MRAYTGYKAEKNITNEPLPAGGYEVVILNAKEETYGWGSVLVCDIDVIEGPYEGYFQKDYNSNTNEDKKWKGKFRLTVPVEGSQYFESNKRAFGNAMWAIEQSNPGFHWAWDEAALKGKVVGALFRNEEWEYDGKTGWTTKCSSLINIDAIKSGEYRIPKDKPLKNKAPDVEVVTRVSDEELPF